MADDSELIGTLKFIAEKISDMDKKVNDMDKKISDIDNKIIRIEVEHGQKLDALFDGYKQNTDMIATLVEGQHAHNERLDKIENRLDRIENKVDALCEKVDKHDIKIQVIEGGKKAQ